VELSLHLGDSNDASRAPGRRRKRCQFHHNKRSDHRTRRYYSERNQHSGIIYDEDGSVTDALLGTGVSNSAYCAGNSAFGGLDNFDVNAQFLHVVIILNGNCALTSSQLPDLQYHLVRVIGRVLGLDWSQVNLNVITRNPPSTAADYAGFPVMHDADPISCVPVSICYSNHGTVNPAQPKMDDQAALSRLYPVTPQNLANFPGKQIFSQSTARVYGHLFHQRRRAYRLSRCKA